VLLATDLLTDEERHDALALVPWREEALQITGRLFGIMANQSIDLIDTAIGPNHARAALVAMYEAADLITQATMEVAESIACERYFTRAHPMDPLRPEPLADPTSVARFPWRLARYAVEDACTHAITAGDHLTNTHIRLAWEINAATEAEVKRCSFDPAAAEPRSWIDVGNLQTGLRKVRAERLSVFSAFEANQAFDTYVAASTKAREYRHAIIHRDRPTYQELPAFGRVTRWTQDAITMHFPALPDDTAPPLSDYRSVVVEAVTAALAYAQTLLDIAFRWLPTVRVRIRLLAEHRIEVQTDQGGSATARHLRDPGAFIRT
jgi:hypothetical protein